MANKINKPFLDVSGKQKQQGFSLIEFAVASVLSMIVLMAVGSGYFAARQLNTAADTRLKFQQDLRNAANMIVRDARMAGSFGCFNLLEEKGDRNIADNNAKTSASDGFKLELYDDDNKLMPVRRLDRASFSHKGFKASSDALIFVYGSGTGNRSQVAANKPTVFSSCQTVLRRADNTVPNDTVLKTELGLDDSRKSEIMYMNYIVNAYVAGEINGQTGLFRFQLDGDDWGDPQLLIHNVGGAGFRYTYVNNCPSEILPANNQFETFEHSSQLSRMPALIQLTLNGGAADPNQIYRINASVRGGNSCANRTL